MLIRDFNPERFEPDHPRLNLLIVLRNLALGATVVLLFVVVLILAF